MPTVGSSPASGWTGVARWEEPHHPGPWIKLGRHANPQDPTLQHKCGAEWDTIRRTELLPAQRCPRNRLSEAVFRVPGATRRAPRGSADLQAVLQLAGPREGRAASQNGR